MSTVDNRAVARRFIEEVLGGGDFAALNALAAPECADHAETPYPATIAQFLVAWRAAFPDLAITIEDLAAAGDTVAVRWTLRGTHRGAFLGRPPTGRAVAVTGIERYRLVDGQIVERQASVDTDGLLRQLGVGVPGVSFHASAPASAPA